MKYLEGVASAKPISRIGLGTWQFGSREWGYGDQYASREAAELRRAEDAARRRHEPDGAEGGDADH